MPESATIEERLSALEKRIDDLTHDSPAPKTARDWKSTFGMSKDDTGFEEMARLGSEYRNSQRLGDDADS